MSRHYHQRGGWYGERADRQVNDGGAYYQDDGHQAHQQDGWRQNYNAYEQVDGWHNNGQHFGRQDDYYTQSAFGGSSGGNVASVGSTHRGRRSDRVWNHKSTNLARYYSSGSRWRGNNNNAGGSQGQEGGERAMSIEPDFDSYDTGSPAQAQTMRLPDEPDYWYMKSTLEPPQTFPAESALPKPLPLLILDLNGTLVYRGGRDANSSKRPNLRPYLSNFLEYCLAVEVEQEDHEKRMQQWKEWDIKRRNDECLSRSSLHGTHFWTDQVEPQPFPEARYRLLVWSSAQPHNVDSMIRAFLPPAQAVQLLRVYARDTLIIQKLIKHKSPSVKDMEVVWSTLNQAQGSQAADLQKAEARVIAEERHQQDAQGMQHYRKTSARLWQSAMELPKFDVYAGHYHDGRGYGPHNTLLLDDSLDKARLQPYNHLLLPEYDASRARKAKMYREQQELDPASTESNEPQDSDERPEDILLQAIGVLEHARKHVNMASWIRYGGLGNFGNMAHEFPLRTLNDHPWHAVNRSVPTSLKLSKTAAEELRSKWSGYFSKSGDYDAGMRFRTRIRERTPAWWAEEGRRALRKAGIEPAIFV